MQILQIASGDFFPTYGGGQVYVKNLVDEMIQECMRHYESIPFIKSDGSMDQTTAFDIITPIFIKHYGWCRAEGKSELADNTVVFGADEITTSKYLLQPSVALYHCNNCS